MVTVVESKTAGRKRLQAERLAQQAFIARESSRRSALDLARECERNKAFGETCSTYWMEQHVARRAMRLSWWVQRVEANLARQRQELAKPTPDYYAIARLKVEAERLRVREVFPDMPCQCRACVKRQGGVVVRQRRWPAIYVGSAGRSFDCWLERNVLDDLDHSQSWSTSSPMVASLEYARRALEEGKQIRPEKQRLLLPESTQVLKLDVMRQNNCGIREVKRLILKGFFVRERLLREVVGQVPHGTPKDVECALQSCVADGLLIWGRGRYKVPLTIDEQTGYGVVVKAAG